MPYPRAKIARGFTVMITDDHKHVSMTVRQALARVGFDFDTGRVFCRLGEVYPTCRFKRMSSEPPLSAGFSEVVEAFGIFARDAMAVYFVEGGGAPMRLTSLDLEAVGFT